MSEDKEWQRCPFCAEEHAVAMRFQGMPVLICPLAPKDEMWGVSGPSVVRFPV